MEFKKVSLHSIPSMRMEADEHIADVLESIGFSESHRNLDTKLVLGYASVGLAGLMYYLEKKFKNNFNNTSYVFYLQLLVASYFILQTILYFFTKFVEKNIKYIGYKKGKKITIKTSTPSKTDLLYEIILEIDGDQHNVSFPLNEVFFDDGYLSLEAFKNKVLPIVQSKDKSK